MQHTIDPAYYTQRRGSNQDNTSFTALHDPQWVPQPMSLTYESHSFSGPQPFDHQKNNYNNNWDSSVYSVPQPPFVMASPEPKPFYGLPPTQWTSENTAQHPSSYGSPMPQYGMLGYEERAAYIYPPSSPHSSSGSSFDMLPTRLVPDEISHQPPMVVCRFGPCGAFVRVTLEELTRHLTEVHGVLKADKKRPQMCQWTDCKCSGKAFRVGRCPSGDISHPAHVENIPEHIWERHLHFRYACKQCDRADWADKSSLYRHSRKCIGRVSVRCGGCYAAFPSELDLMVHGRVCTAP